MLTVNTSFPLLTYSVVYFPTESELRSAYASLPSHSIVRVKQAPEPADGARCVDVSPFYAICLDLSRPIDDLFRATDATCRNAIRRAEKMAGRIAIRTGAEEIPAMVELHNELARAKGHSGSLSPRLLSKYAGISDAFALYLDDRPMCAHFWLRDESRGRVRHFFSATTRLQSKEDSALSGILNRYLHWHEIRKYKDEGFRLYDLGGFTDEADAESSLAKFKLSFGAATIREYDVTLASGMGKLAFRMYRMAPRVQGYLRGILPH
jgi:hypothetical protein